MLTLNNQGIDVNKLKIGTRIFVATKNSLYKFLKEDADTLVVQGGKLKKPTKVNFSGSTFGGSVIKVGWIGHQMYMEMYIIKSKKTFKTSQVVAARVVGDNWEYSMDWK